jgi:DNA mismatch repair protein MutL
MTRIRVLPPAIASQIAAGEVVERPASAAKELIENALDAEATRCDVECSGGGISLLSVADDGFGMDEENAQLALERHATSKLQTLGDLEHLQSYGFRGEALPSIASVSRLELRTRARGSEVGASILVEGGECGPCRIESMPVGTVITIRDLFFNVPARRKFLRSTGTESSHVTQVVEGAALSRHEVTFTLTRDGRRVREMLRCATRAERVSQLFPDEPLAAVQGSRGPLTLAGFLCAPERARPGASGLWLLVNGRPIRDRMLATTVAQAYGSVLSHGNYPRGVLYLELPPPLVDVNVHPQKAEVRFADPRAVADAAYSILSKELGVAFSLPPSVRGARHARTDHGVIPNPQESLSHPRLPDTPKFRESSPLVDSVPPTLPLVSLEAAKDTGDVGEVSDPWGLGRAPEVCVEPSAPTPRFDSRVNTLPEEPSLDELSPLLRVGDALEPMVRAPSTKEPQANWGGLRFLVQVRLTFLVCEGSDGLYVIDQHAAAERVSFHRLMEQYRARAVASQALLFPAMVELTGEETALIEQRQEDFASIGMDVRIRDRERATVHTVPRLLEHASPERLLRDLLGELSRTGGRGFSAAIEHALALMACHGSLRAGEAILPQKAQALLAALDGVDFAAHCAHGRPVVAVMSYAELERKVGRR